MDKELTDLIQAITGNTEASQVNIELHTKGLNKDETLLDVVEPHIVGLLAQPSMTVPQRELLQLLFSMWVEAKQYESF